jgi:hypothetical protein
VSIASPRSLGRRAVESAQYRLGRSHRASIPVGGTYRDIVEIKLDPSPVPLPSGWWRHAESDTTERRELARRVAQGIA